MAKLGTGQFIHHLTATCSQVLFYRTNVHSAPNTSKPKGDPTALYSFCDPKMLFQDFYLKGPWLVALSMDCISAWLH